MNEFDLPTDICYYLMQYLKPNDGMSFSLSGVSPRFTSFFSERRQWILSRCYSLIPLRCKHFFAQHNFKRDVKVIDLSHCYWFSTSTIISSLINFNNLEELHVNDTKTSLTSIGKIFEKCHSIKKLSIDVKENNWSEYLDTTQRLRSGDKALKEGIKKLISLRLCFKGNSCGVWHLIFQVLSWCRDCVDLHLEVSYTANMWCKWRDGEEDNSESESESASTNIVRQSLFPQLKWMSSLQNFTYIKKGIRAHFNDHICFHRLFDWFLSLQDPPKCLEQFWILSLQEATLCWESHLQSSLTHLCLGKKTTFQPEMKKITHLGGIHSFSAIPHMPNLKFIQGYCSSSLDLETFCQLHPQLEHLYFDSNCHRITFEHEWKLNCLKSLVYACDLPEAHVISKLTEACPNLEELHVDNRWNGNDIFLREPVAYNLHQISTLKHLKTLTLDGLEFNTFNSETFFVQLFQNCRHLECLHISGQFEGDQYCFHQNLCKYLPLAKNLRDFRFQREQISDNMLLEMLSAVQFCSRLERLVLHQVDWSSISNDLSSLPVVLESVISNSDHLVVLCITHPVPEWITETVREMLRMKIVTKRPAFWFHMGDSLPLDVHVPRIHLDEIIQPASYFFSPPKSFHQSANRSKSKCY